ncbi:MAG: hypothetical protein KAT65_14270 [Methanophagales archaeon]|nr:hypothetical protein [Methanophagales archaeon]
MRDERTLFLWERKPVLKESSFGKAFLSKKRFVFDQTFQSLKNKNLGGEKKKKWKTKVK